MNFGLHRGGDGHFKNAIGHRCGFHAKLDIDSGLLLLQQNRGRIGLLQRGLFQVHALDLKNRFSSRFVGNDIGGVSHEVFFRVSKKRLVQRAGRKVEVRQRCSGPGDYYS